jgi:hypothetical protein
LHWVQINHYNTSLAIRVFELTDTKAHAQLFFDRYYSGKQGVLEFDQFSILEQSARTDYRFSWKGKITDRINKYLLIFSILFSLLNAADNIKMYEEPYHDHILYLHPLINYVPSLDWHYDWHKNLYKKNGFYISTGSVTTDDLLIDGRLVINQELGKGWWFRGSGMRYESRHLYNFNHTLFMGFDKQIYRKAYLFLQVNPYFDKEYTDVITGLAIYSNDSEQYIRLGLLLEDFIYDDKNAFNAISDQTPLAFRWFLRYSWGDLTLYSDGKFSRGFERRYPDRRESPQITSHAQQTDYSVSKVYYRWHETNYFLIAYSTYYFDEQQTYVDSLFNYIYGNDLDDVGFEGYIGFMKKNYFHFLVHYLWQKAKSSEYRAHCFSRNDFLWGMFYERSIKRSRLDFGYMMSLFDFVYNGLAGQGGYARQGYVDKLKLGWTYLFPQGARLQLSLSHELSSGEFGGANLQYLMFF